MTLRRASRFWGVKGGNFVNPDFVFTINTANTSTGSSASNTFVLPLINIGTHNFTVDWGDSSSSIITAWDDTDKTKVYASSGVYTVTITGTMGGWRFNNTGDRLKMITISNWGCFRIIAGYVFYGCANLDITATDNPTEITSLTGLIYNCSSLVFNSSINNWDVSGVVGQVLFMAYNAVLFNQPINNWDVSGFTTFQNSLRNTAFNQPLNLWDVSNITRFDETFRDSDFNQDISMWDITAANNSQSFIRFLHGAPFNTANYDLLLVGWAAQSLNSGIQFHAGTAKYSAGAPAAARAVLTGTYGWSITDGGPV